MEYAAHQKRIADWNISRVFSLKEFYYSMYAANLYDVFIALNFQLILIEKSVH